MIDFSSTELASLKIVTCNRISWFSEVL